MIRDLIGWAQSDVLLGQLVDTAGDERGAGVYLVGHSRGGKISTLEALEDSRVRAACLLDPVDNTVYAPLGAGFPSALAAMRERGGAQNTPPLLVVGGEAEATARRRGRTTLTSRARGGDPGRGARGRRALPVPGQRHVRAEGGVRGGPRLRRGGAGREPGAHGGARRDCLPQRAAPRRATRHAAEAGGRARLGRARGTGFENAGGSLDGVAGFDVMIWVYFAPERYRTLKISDTKAHARRAHASVSLRSSSDQSSGSPSESGSSGSSSESSARTPVL